MTFKSKTANGQVQNMIVTQVEARSGEPVEIAGGVARTFLEDGDSLVMRGWCQGDGYRIGFGEVEGTILPAE